MPSPFPGMDPFVEKNPIFHELHTQILAHAQAQLQPQVRPKYIARLERHLAEGSVWELNESVISLDRKEPDLTIAAHTPGTQALASQLPLTAPTVTLDEELDEDEMQLRKQRRIVIYVNARPRLAVASIELLSPSNKETGAATQARYLEKRASALNGGLHWIEIDLLRGGERPPIPMKLPDQFDYLTYVAQATPTGWSHLAYTWLLRDELPRLAIPLLGTDQAALDLGVCFDAAYDATGADDDADYEHDPPPPPLRSEDAAWVDALLREKGLRTGNL